MTNVSENVVEFVRMNKARDSNTSPPCLSIGKLGLPDLRDRSALRSVSCRTDTIRTSATSDADANVTHRSRAPAYCDPDKAIIQFRMYVRGEDADDDDVTLFAFVACRGDLLRLVHSVFKETNGSRPLRWEQWGPHLTRWSGTEETDTAWTGGIAGQRQIFISGDRPCRIHIRDFNPATVKRAETRTLPLGTESVRLHKEPGIVAHQNCFKENIYSTLPYVETQSEQRFNYDGVLIDDEHAIGLIVSGYTHG